MIDIENAKVAIYVDNVPIALATIPFIEQSSENSALVEWVAEAGSHEIGAYVSLENINESNYSNNTAVTNILVKETISLWLLVIPFLCIGGIVIFLLYRKK